MRGHLLKGQRIVLHDMLMGLLVMGQLHVSLYHFKKLSFSIKAKEDLNDFNILYLKIFLLSPLLDFAQPILYILKTKLLLNKANDKELP